MNLVPQTTPSVQTTPPIQTKDLPLIAKTPHKAYPSEKTKHPPNLVLDEGYAWRMFKEIITDNEVNLCYNMSVKDFEHFAIHDLFKVCGFHYFSFIFYKIQEKFITLLRPFLGHVQVLHYIHPSYEVLRLRMPRRRTRS